MISEIHFNSSIDLQDVDQFGYVDLGLAMATGSVPACVAASDDHYNGLDDPSAIGRKPSDVFDALSMSQSLKTGQSSDDSDA